MRETGPFPSQKSARSGEEPPPGTAGSFMAPAPEAAFRATDKCIAMKNSSASACPPPRCAGSTLPRQQPGQLRQPRPQRGDAAPGPGETRAFPPPVLPRARRRSALRARPVGSRAVIRQNINGKHALGSQDPTSV